LLALNVLDDERIDPAELKRLKKIIEDVQEAQVDHRNRLWRRMCLAVGEHGDRWFHHAIWQKGRRGVLNGNMPVHLVDPSEISQPIADPIRRCRIG
jgi:hypothetical protein